MEGHAGGSNEAETGGEAQGQTAASLHRDYDAEPASVYLIRPDGYLAFRADWPDRHVVLEFLESYLI